jgi:transcriptional regulator with XRE-family HTH domain
MRLEMPQALGVKRLRALRQAAGLTQVQLAEMAGLTQSFISRLEQGKTDVSVSHMVAIANAVGVRPSDLLELGSAQSRLLVAIDNLPEDQRETAADILEMLARRAKPQE